MKIKTTIKEILSCYKILAQTKLEKNTQLFKKHIKSQNSPASILIAKQLLNHCFPTDVTRMYLRVVFTRANT